MSSVLGTGLGIGADGAGAAATLGGAAAAGAGATEAAAGAGLAVIGELMVVVGAATGFAADTDGAIEALAPFGDATAVGGAGAVVADGEVDETGAAALVPTWAGGCGG
jgi:type IV secretion system protein TrbL